MGPTAGETSATAPHFRRTIIKCPSELLCLLGSLTAGGGHEQWDRCRPRAGSSVSALWLPRRLTKRVDFPSFTAASTRMGVQKVDPATPPLGYALAGHR